MTDRIRNILERLDQVREDLLALSDDIWLGIDHNDPATLEEGVASKRDYDSKMAAFDQLAGEISALVQRFTAVKLNGTLPIDHQTPQAAERIIRDLDHRQAYTLDKDLTFKRPYGFQLEDEAQIGVSSWRLFDLACLHLQRHDPQQFTTLPSRRSFISRRGNPAFSHDPQALCSAMPLPDGRYTEANLLANHLWGRWINLIGGKALGARASGSHAGGTPALRVRSTHLKPGMIPVG